MKIGQFEDLKILSRLMITFKVAHLQIMDLKHLSQINKYPLRATLPKGIVNAHIGSRVLVEF